MGYSGRYHAASLVAVFIALAIGLLIGIGIADDVVSTASQELESSLRSDLDAAESRAEELDSMLARERDFGDRIYPALVSGRLAASSVAVIGVGGLPESTASDIEAAVGPAGASVDAVAVIGVPPDPAALADAAPPEFAAARRGGEELRKLGRAVGSGLAGGSPLVERLRGDLFSRFSGSLADVNRIVLVGSDSEGLDPEQRAAKDAFVGGLLDGVRRSAAGAVSVERTDTDPTTLAPFSEAGIPTVDHIDLTAGRVAAVFSLLGAGGDYGIKDGADSFLPELITPARRSAPPAASGAGTLP